MKLSAGVYLWLVAYPDGHNPKVCRSVSARGAILSRVKDDDDPVAGVLCAWRLGNFPEQYEIVGPRDVREVGRPSVAASRPAADTGGDET